MSECTDEQIITMLTAIKDNFFLPGNHVIYKFNSQQDFDDVIQELLDDGYIDYKYPPNKTRRGNISFNNKDYKITEI